MAFGEMEPPQAMSGSRRLVRRGSFLLAGGAFLWFVHCVSLLLGTLILARVDIADLTHQYGVVQTGLMAYEAATVAALVGAILLGIGLLVYQRGVGGLRREGGVRAMRYRTRFAARAGAVCFFLYGLLAAIGVWEVAEMWSSARSGRPFAILEAALVALVMWLVASFLLIGCAVLYGLFLRFLRFDSGTREPLVGSEFLAYSVANPMGIPLLIGAVAVGLADRNLNLPTDFAPTVLVAPMQLLAMPVIGSVLWISSFMLALRLRKI